MELFGEFLKENEEIGNAAEHTENAHSCCEKWGALALVVHLDAANS